MKRQPSPPRDPPPLYWQDPELGMTADGRVFRKGGPRPNAGRKPSGRKPFLIRLKPQAHVRLRQLARAAGHSTLGAYLEALVPTEG